ncbi:MAG: class I SAM-dependent methyltransferase [Polyangiaceae bacterium]|nr:class I SAM-dependent methyltransferase [Polyangiaceae bacterium]
MPDPYRLADDPHAAGLVPGVLALPARAIAAAPFAAGAVHRGLGLATFGLNYHVPLRTRAIDDAIRDAIAAGATQLVVLGAGLDARAMRMRELAGVRAFEVDHPSTQRYKLARLARRPAPPLARSLARVAVDFERDRLEDALPSAGFRPDEPAMWIWEGVTPYLTPDAVAGTIAVIGALSAPGSRVALTYRAGAEVPWPALRAGEALLRLVGEPMLTQLPPGAMAELLARSGLRRLSDESTVDWAARYWPWQRGVRPIERLAIAERDP